MSRMEPANSNRESSYSVADFFKKADKVCDYLPGVSLLSNTVDGVVKLILHTCVSKETINQNKYYRHIDEKTPARCVTSAIPIFGNIKVYFDDWGKKNKKESVRRYEESILYYTDILEGRSRPARGLDLMLDPSLVSDPEFIKDAAKFKGLHERIAKSVVNCDNLRNDDDFMLKLIDEMCKVYGDSSTVPHFFIKAYEASDQPISKEVALKLLEKNPKSYAFFCTKKPWIQPLYEDFDFVKKFLKLQDSIERHVLFLKIIR